MWTLTPPKTHVNILKIKNWTPPFKHPNNIYFINILLSPNIFYLLRYRTIYASMSQFFYPFLFEVFGLKNPKIQTSQIPSSSIVLNLYSTKKPRRSWIDPHLDYETGVHILFVDAACRCFDFSGYISVTLWPPFNSTTSSNHLKTNLWLPWWNWGVVVQVALLLRNGWNLMRDVFLRKWQLPGLTFLK